MNETMRRGEEFRDGQRRGSPLPAELVRALSAIDPLKATLALGQTVGVLAAAIAAAILWWSPLVVLGSIVVIATRQQACFVLAHDAAHYRLYETRWLNDAVGRFFGAVVGPCAPIASSTASITIIFTSRRTRICRSMAAIRAAGPIC